MCGDVENPSLGVADDPRRDTRPGAVGTDGFAFDRGEPADKFVGFFKDELELFDALGIFDDWRGAVCVWRRLNHKIWR